MLRGERLYLDVFLGIGERDLTRFRQIGGDRLCCLLRDEERLCTFLACGRSRDGVLLLDRFLTGGEIAGLLFSDDLSLLCSMVCRFGVGDLLFSIERFLEERERLRLS